MNTKKLLGIAAAFALMAVVLVGAGAAQSTITGHGITGDEYLITVDGTSASSSQASDFTAAGLAITGNADDGYKLTFTENAQNYKFIILNAYQPYVDPTNKTLEILQIGDEDTSNPMNGVEVTFNKSLLSTEFETS